MAISLIRHAERDSRTARDLWALAAASQKLDETRILKRHAVDKSGHVLSRLDVLGLSCRRALDPTLRSALLDLSPGYSIELPLPPSDDSTSGPSIGNLLEANLAAIRSIVLEIMERAAVRGHCGPEHVPQVTKIVDAILRDELNRVADTARLVEARVADMDPSHTADLFSKCLRRFIRLTSEEPIDINYNLRFGNYP